MVLTDGDAASGWRHSRAAQNEILQKVLLPHMRGYARIEGSNFDARDFIIAATGAANEKATNTRERLQQALLAKVQPRCQELGIEIRAVLLGEMKPPAELSEQISQRDLARVEQQKNAVRLGQYKEMQKLKSIETMKEQAREMVEANTRLQVMQTQAKQQKEVEELKLKQELDNAKIGLEAARSRAEAMMARGKASAAVIQLQNEAEVAAAYRSANSPAPAHFAQYHVISKLARRKRFLFRRQRFRQLFSGAAPPGPRPQIDVPRL